MAYNLSLKKNVNKLVWKAETDPNLKYVKINWLTSKKTLNVSLKPSACFE